MVSPSFLYLTLIDMALLMHLSLFSADLKAIGVDTENMFRQKSSYDFI
jgi:hypothetical protein